MIQIEIWTPPFASSSSVAICVEMGKKSIASLLRQVSIAILRRARRRDMGCANPHGQLRTLRITTAKLEGSATRENPVRDFKSLAF